MVVLRGVRRGESLSKRRQQGNGVDLRRFEVDLMLLDEFVQVPAAASGLPSVLVRLLDVLVARASI